MTQWGMRTPAFTVVEQLWAGTLSHKDGCSRSGTQTHAAPFLDSRVARLAQDWRVAAIEVVGQDLFAQQRPIGGDLEVRGRRSCFCCTM